MSGKISKRGKCCDKFIFVNNNKYICDMYIYINYLYNNILIILNNNIKHNILIILKNNIKHTLKFYYNFNI